MNTGSLISVVFFAVLKELANRKRYCNSSWFSPLYGAEKSRKTREIWFCQLTVNRVTVITELILTWRVSFCNLSLRRFGVAVDFFASCPLRRSLASRWLVTWSVTWCVNVTCVMDDVLIPSVFLAALIMGWRRWLLRVTLWRHWLIAPPQYHISDQSSFSVLVLGNSGVRNPPPGHLPSGRYKQTRSFHDAKPGSRPTLYNNEITNLFLFTKRYSIRSHTGTKLNQLDGW